MRGRRKRGVDEMRQMEGRGRKVNEKRKGKGKEEIKGKGGNTGKEHWKRKEIYLDFGSQRKDRKNRGKEMKEKINDENWHKK